MKSVFGTRLKQLRCGNDLRIQEFVDLYNARFGESKLSKSIVSRYENNIHLPKRFQIVLNIAQFFNVDTDYLMGISNHNANKSDLSSMAETVLIKIPILLSIDSTGPVYSQETISEMKSSFYNNYDELFYFKADDSNMIGSGIVTGSYILFTSSFIPKDGDIVALYVKNAPIQIRKYFNRESVAALFADCNGVDPILIQKSDIETGQIKLLGKALKITTIL